MSERDKPPSDDVKGDEASSTATSGRGAFEALNPYGDFGGPGVSRAQLLTLGLVSVLAVGGVLALGGVLVAEHFGPTKPEARQAPPALDEPTDVAASPSTPSDETDDSLEPADGEGPADEAAADDEEPADGTVPTPPPSRIPPTDETRQGEGAPRAPASPPPAPPQQRGPKPKPQPKPERALVLTSVRDNSRAPMEGLDEALERGFLQRLASVAPELVARRGGARSDDLGVRLVLTRLSARAGGGVHDVTARCVLGATRPRGALPDGAIHAQGKQQGMEASDGLRADAAERCGAQLAESVAPLARQYLKRRSD